MNNNVEEIMAQAQTAARDNDIYSARDLWTLAASLATRADQKARCDGKVERYNNYVKWGESAMQYTQDIKDGKVKMVTRTSANGVKHKYRMRCRGKKST